MIIHFTRQISISKFFKNLNQTIFITAWSLNAFIAAMDGIISSFLSPFLLQYPLRSWSRFILTLQMVYFKVLFSSILYIQMLFSSANINRAQILYSTAVGEIHKWKKCNDVPDKWNWLQWSKCTFLLINPKNLYQKYNFDWDTCQVELMKRSISWGLKTF